MASFHERYVAGDCEAVWADLVALGDEVRREPVLADALAVATEMANRAKHNIELIHGRLVQLGFQFASRERSLIWTTEHSLQRLDEIERQWDTFPLSVHKWFETFDCVCLLPGKQSAADADEIPNYGFDCLVVDGLDDAYEKWLETCRAFDKDPAGYYGWDPRKEPWLIIGTPASNCSYRGINLPSLRADEVFYNEGNGDVYFVQELRDCFRWGGFRFLRGFADSPRPILPGVSLAVRDLIPLLTEGLKPI